METFEEKLKRVLAEVLDIAPYSTDWPKMFCREVVHLRNCLPAALIGRIEHFGSTAVPGLAAKPIIDMLIEVRDLQETKMLVVPVLEAQGYDYFWRPTFGNDTPPFYAWFIKRDSFGKRTHHLHMVEPHFEHWNRLLFRDYLKAHREVREEYSALKIQLARDYSTDRAAYTRAKTDFIVKITALAMQA